MLLAKHSGEGLTLRELTDLTGLAASRVSMAKDDLVKKGWAVEHYPARDKRTRRFYLTDEGHQRADALWDAARLLVALEQRWRGERPRDQKFGTASHTTEM